MDEHVYDELRATIKRTAVEVPGILGTEKCFIRKAGMYYHIDLHARVDGDLSVREGHSLSHALKDHLARTHPELSHILIHIEPCENLPDKTDATETSGNKQ
jgi:divalent metal cation (Fe/Co/Zn/Cd) transporter